MLWEVLSILRTISLRSCFEPIQMKTRYIYFRRKKTECTGSTELSQQKNHLTSVTRDLAFYSIFSSPSLISFKLISSMLPPPCVSFRTRSSIVRYWPVTIIELEHKMNQQNGWLGTPSTLFYGNIWEFFPNFRTPLTPPCGNPSFNKKLSLF